MQTLILEDARLKNYRWLVMIVVMIGTLMSALDASIVNVSIPSIMADFGSSVQDIEWVITGYMIAFATLMPLTAWLRDRIGYKVLYTNAMLVFTLGSLFCGAAWNLPTLIFARVIQALGGGAITPTGMAMISEVFPAKERGKALGLWGMGVILGPAFGPTLGGFLTKTFGWRSIFLINLPIGIIGIMLALRFLVKDKPHHANKRPFDTWGFIFLSAFLVSFLLALSKGEEKGWTSQYIFTCAVISIFSFIGFLLVELNIRDKIIDISLFKSPVFSICSVISAARSLVLYGGIFLLPLFMQQQMGLDEMQSGLVLMPGSILIAIVMPIVGRISDRIGPKYLSIAGLACIGCFMYMYRYMDVNMTIFNVIKPTLVRGIGLGLLMAPVMAAAVNSVPTHKAGMASSMLNITQQVGGSLGIAILSTVLTNRIHFHLGVVGTGAMTAMPSFVDSFKNIFSHVHNLGYTYAQSRQIANTFIMKQLSVSATVMAFQDAFLVGALTVMIALVAAFFLPGRIKPHAHEADVEKGIIEDISSLE